MTAPILKFLKDLAEFTPANDQEYAFVSDSLGTCEKYLKFSGELPPLAIEYLSIIASTQPRQTYSIKTMAATLLQRFPESRDALESLAAAPVEIQEIERQLEPGSLAGYTREIEILHIIDLPAETFPTTAIDLASCIAEDLDEGQSLQIALRAVPPEGLCVWSSGKLSGKFAHFCGEPQATQEERATVRRALGYGPMPEDKPSLCKTQPYCATHIRMGIQPARRSYQYTS